MKITPNDKQITDFWDYEKNSGKSPYNFTSGSVFIAWWKCPVCKYEWQTSVNHKYRGDKCPLCSGRVVKPGVNDLLSKFPGLAKEWDYQSNDITPDKVFFKANKKYNWICPKGHNYSATVYHRIAGTGCPFCANKQVLTGFNDLASKFPDIASEWNYEKNDGLTPDKIVYGSNKKVWWKCKICGKEWPTKVINRTLSGTGCPDCGFVRGVKKKSAKAAKENNFAEKYPEIAKDWDYEKNYPVRPEDISCKSNKKYFWICPVCKWNWPASPNARTKGSGCPACVNKEVVPGKNDLQTLFPKIAQEWNYEKNKGTTPDMIVAGSNKVFWWKCSKCGHEWKSSVNNRTGKNGSGCKKCGIKESANKRVKRAAEKNNFALKYPTIAKEWDYEKNIGLLPEDFSCKSNKIVSWKCSFCGSQWTSSIAGRTSRKSTCPKCTYVGTSFPEQAIYFYVKKQFSDAENRQKVGKYEFDIYIPSIKTAIEYDGVYYHRNKTDKDNKKDKYCLENDINLIRFRDPELENTDYAKRITIRNGSIKELNKALIELMKILTEKDHEINVEQDQIEILSIYKREVEENSLGKLFPDLVKEWDYEKNGNITPFNIKPYSNIKINWKCSKCGYKWKAQVYDRTRKDGATGCPVCANKIIVSGQNDLATKYPELAKEWHPNKNKGLLPSMVSPGSNKKVWWLCLKCESEWQAAPSTRTSQGCGCPTCAGKRVKPGFNDFATTCPELIKEWNYEKNGDLVPEKITRGSHKKVWWKCLKGHEWQSTIHNRVQGNNCPECYLERREHEKVIPGQIKFEEE